MRRPENYASVWDALADTPGQAANLRARAELMQQIAALVKRQGWTQVEAAKRCGVTQPRINDLLRGRVSRFSLDALSTLRRRLVAGYGLILKQLKLGSARGGRGPYRSPARATRREKRIGCSDARASHSGKAESCDHWVRDES